MAKPYDATGKDLLELSPTGWLDLLGVYRPPEKVAVIDADDPPWILHVEFQTGRDAFLPGRMMLYNAALHSRHLMAVSSVAFLLRPEADDAELTGRYRVAPPFGPEWAFGNTIVRVWELPVEE
ncbi:MAG TPA: hypothetical protein VGJ05_12075 [Fimbriiglobus sp.]